tara:strand:- start:1358 stop:2242 length:885 start_codon:yes stop_codon:yes gene_type:complete
MNNKLLSSHKGKEPESRVLYIVGTPIGNLNDLSSRAINILKNVSFVACEDTRQTKKIMNKFEISNNLISFNKHNSFKKIPKIIEDLNSGKSMALVSDAGMPGICDPGEELINNVKNIGLNVICIPGPCAVITALVSSGLPASKFIFEGFMPKKKSERKKILLEISKNEKTTIFFESPHRLKASLEELKEYCGGEKEIQVFRELTKQYEEHIGETINEVLIFFKGKEVKGEITIVVKGINKKNTDNEFDRKGFKRELNELINAGLSLSAASKYLAKKNNLPKNLIYNLYQNQTIK